MSNKNALRLAITETNMAYRLADWERWQQMDFVVGIRIQLSNNHTCLGKDGEPHPFHDICDELAGDYPKSFKWVGWHPQCRCNAVPILKTVDEKIADNLAKRNGGTAAKDSVNSVKRMPKAFTDWIKDNKDRIGAAKSQPYFIRDNATEVAKIIPGVLPESVLPATPAPVLSIAERAQMRHEARTAEQVEAIKNAWNEKQNRDRITRKMGEHVLATAKKWQEVDYTELQRMVESGQLTGMREKAKQVAQAIKAMRDQEKALSDLIPNVHDWHKRFTFEQLKSTHDAVVKTLERPNWAIDKMNADSLARLKSTIQHEIDWMARPDKGQKYDTWEVSRAAYVKHLQLVEHRIEMAAVRDSIKREIALVGASKSIAGKKLVAEFDTLFDDDAADLQRLRLISDNIKAKAVSIEKNRLRNTGAKKVGQSSTIVQTDDEVRDNFIAYADSIGVKINPNDVVIDKGFIHLQVTQQERIYKALKIESQEERNQLWNHLNAVGTHGGRGGYVRTGNSFKINKYFRDSGVVGAIDKTAVAKLKAIGANDDDIKTIKLLDKKISEFSTPIPLRVTRYVQKEALSKMFGESINIDGGIEKMMLSIKNGKQTMRPDEAYMSASTNEKANVFIYYEAKLEIEVPKGTKMYFTNNYAESEVVFGRGTKLKYIDSHIVTEKDRFGGYYKQLVIRCRIDN